MAATSKIDAHHANALRSLILPFKRKIGSLNIRIDVWEGDLNSKSVTRNETRSGAVEAITEVDGQMSQLADLKWTDDKNGRDAAAKVKALVDAFSEIRLTLVRIASAAAAA